MVKEDLDEILISLNEKLLECNSKGIQILDSDDSEFKIKEFFSDDDNVIYFGTEHITVEE